MKKKRSAAKIRVMVVDDHSGMRAALREVINLHPDMSVVAEADSGISALNILKSARPDVILMDGSMPGMNGIEVTCRLKQLQPELKIVGLTLYGETTYLEEMITAGARGYVLKTCGPEMMIKAVQAVAAGGTYFDPAVPRRSKSKRKQPATSEELREEELDVAKLLADGQTTAEIARTLGVNLSVVERRKTTVMEKLGLRTRAELVRVAARRNWLDS